MLESIAHLFPPARVSDLLLIAGKTTVVYLFLIAGLRLLGKRELGQMNIYDLVLIIVLANAVQNAMVGNDTTLMGGIVAAVTLLLWNRVFTLLIGRSRRLERLMVGEPRLILNDGHFLMDRMRREGVTRDEVMSALREHGLSSPSEARMCVLEVDGSLSIVPKDAPTHRSHRHFKALRLS